MMAAIRKNPTNGVTERDKAIDPIGWVQKMNMFQSQVHKTICSDLIYN